MPDEPITAPPGDPSRSEGPTPAPSDVPGKPPAATPHGAAHEDHASVKETLIALVIAFTLAFVFRGFVIEAFVIPTGSMAPTLLGQHMRFKSADAGTDWAVSPWAYADRDGTIARASQGTPEEPVIVHDPMTKRALSGYGIERRAGDRIFVLKYLYSIFEPSRFDVVVFKNPQSPDDNFIKRLIGLPNEEIALVDGDIFTRPAGPDAGDGNWDATEWTIRRKPRRVQDAVWQAVFTTEHAPVGGDFLAPWVPTTPGWDLSTRREYRYDPPAGVSGTSLAWDDAGWPITDRYAYNEYPATGEGSWTIGFRQDTAQTGGLPVRVGTAVYPVSDIRVRVSVKPDAPGQSVSLTLRARGMEFLAAVGDGVRLASRPLTPDDAAPWAEMARAEFAGLAPGRFTNLEFSHADQSLTVLIDGEPVCEASYTMSPARRVEAATGATLGTLLARERGDASALSDSDIYRPAQVSLSLEGGAVTLRRIALDRDLFYQPFQKRGEPPLGTHPRFPRVLGHDQYFCCGDNSPASDDCRYWTAVDPWVADQIDPEPGVVPRDLLIGKAFFVYFPAIQHERVLGVRVPVPDFGRARFIF